MRFLKKIESFNRRLLYGLIGLFLKNKKLDERLDPATVKKVLILRYDVLGDMLVTLPMIKLIKQIAPHCKVHVLASEKNRQIVISDSNIDKVHTFNGRIVLSFFNLLSLRKEKYDVIFAAYYTLVTRNGIISNIIGGSKAIKVNAWQDEKRYLFFNYQSHKAAKHDSMWEKMYYMAADTFIGGDNYVQPEPYIEIDNLSEQRCSANLQNFSLEVKSYALVNLSAGRIENSWGIQSYIDLINSIIKNTDLSVLMICIKRDSAIGEKIVNYFWADSDRVKLYPMTSNIMEVTSLVKHSKISISPDTGFVHIATATKAPIVVLYPNEYVVRLWGPYNIAHRSVISSSGEIKDILPIDVFHKFEELLREIESNE